MLEGPRKFIIEKILDPKGRYSRGFIDVGSEGVELGVTPKGLNVNDLYRMWKQSSLLRGVIDTISRAAISNGYRIVRVSEAEKVEQEHKKELEEFFRYPNPTDDMDTVLSDLVTDLMIFANAYLEVVFKDGKPAGLYNLDATTMKVHATPKGEIKKYSQTIQGQKKIEFKPQEVIHFKTYAKGSDLYGLSKLESLVLTIDADLKAQLYIGAYFNNYGAPKGLYFMEEGTDEDVQAARAYLKQVASDPQKAHRSWLIKGKIRYEEIASSFKEAQVLDLRKFHRDEILTVFGVPPAKAQFIETGNLGSGAGESQNRTFYQETIFPLQRKIAGKINRCIVNNLLDIYDYEFAFVPMLVEDRKKLAEIHEIYRSIDVLSEEEIRSELGLEKKKAVSSERVETAEKSLKLRKGKR